MKDKLFFFGSWAPRYVRRSNDYLFTRSETDTIEQEQTFNSAFGKVNYDPTSRLRTSFSVLWTPTTSTGTLPAYNGLARELDLELEGVEPDPEDARVRDPADELRRHARLHADQLVAHQRARRLLRRQLQGHRRADLQQRHVPDQSPIGARLSDSART